MLNILYFWTKKKKRKKMKKKKKKVMEKNLKIYLDIERKHTHKNKKIC